MTADIHVIKAKAFQLLVLSLGLGGISRSVFGPLPFWACFVLTEMYKVAFSFCIGMMNVSAFIQMVIITNIRQKSEEYLPNLIKNIHNFCLSFSFRYSMICLAVVSKLFPITGSLTSVLGLVFSILASTSENISW